MQRRILTMIATVCVIIFCAVSYQGIRSLASSGEEQVKFKYYTQVTLAYGETLWNLSEDYIDYEEYKDMKTKDIAALVKERIQKTIHENTVN